MGLPHLDADLPSLSFQRSSADRIRWRRQRRSSPSDMTPVAWTSTIGRLTVPLARGEPRIGQHPRPAQHQRVGGGSGSGTYSGIVTVNAVGGLSLAAQAKTHRSSMTLRRHGRLGSPMPAPIWRLSRSCPAPSRLPGQAPMFFIGSSMEGRRVYRQRGDGERDDKAGRHPDALAEPLTCGGPRNVFEKCSTIGQPGNNFDPSPLSVERSNPRLRGATGLARRRLDQTLEVALSS